MDNISFKEIVRNIIMLKRPFDRKTAKKKKRHTAASNFRRIKNMSRRSAGKQFTVVLNVTEETQHRSSDFGKIMRFAIKLRGFPFSALI